MNILSKDIQYYYLNYDGYTDRRKKMELLISKLNINCIRVGNNVENPLRQNRISSGFINLLKLAILNNKFPFITMDDDVELIDKFPENINIPESADLIFLGGSLYECGGIKPTMYLKNYDNDYYRVYYMLSLHSMIVPTVQSAIFLIESVTKSLENNDFPDIGITMYSEYKCFLTPKDGPYFYQNNYNAQCTNFLWKTCPVVIK